MSAVGMPYRPMGRSGVKISAMGLGGWTTFGESVQDKSVVQAVLTAAVEAGVNFFDIADVYARGASERAMGAVLKQFPRHELIISSKVFFPMSDAPNDRGLSRKHIFESIDRSLKNIGTDYLDIYFCHRFDENTPIEETARAMDDLVHQGKILYWGTSEWTGKQLRSVHEHCDHRNLYAPRVEQPQCSLLVRNKYETDVQPAAEEMGMGLVVWSPLASGLLTGKYDQGVPAGSRLSQIDWLRESVLKEERIERVRKMETVAKRLGCSRTQLALAWAASRRGVSSVILGATAVEQLRENLAALEVEVTAETERDLDAIFPQDL